VAQHCQSAARAILGAAKSSRNIEPRTHLVPQTQDIDAMAIFKDTIMIKDRPDDRAVEVIVIAPEGI
jgi:hypothetical protein